MFYLFVAGGAALIGALDYYGWLASEAELEEAAYCEARPQDCGL
jgi:hypothetical protein